MKKALLVLAVLAGPVLSAKVEEGLLFRSYDVVSDLRTSLTVSDEGNTLSFRDSLTLSFDVRLELDRGRFGYVCRLFVDGNDPVDLLLSTPEGGRTSLVATGDHRNMVPVFTSDPVLSQWQTFRISIQDRDGVLYTEVNGEQIHSVPSDLSRHEFRISFGKGGFGKHSTTDVAPMVLKNLRLRSDARRPYFWTLSDDAAFKQGVGPSIQIGNPVWMQDYNRKWRKVWSQEMPSATYICPDTLRGRIWFVSEGKVVLYDVASGTATAYPSARKMKIGLATNDFVVLPDGTLSYADVEASPQLIRFDTGIKDWERDNPRTRSSVYLHHNTVFLPQDSSYLYLFGYGQYRYRKSAKVWNPVTGASSQMELPGVFPRYLSGAGLHDGLIYVLGGKGNEVGIQELGVNLYNDFFSLDLSDGTVRRLWKSDLMSTEVAVPDLLFQEDGASFLTLTYSPDVFESALQLRRFSMEDGASQPLGYPIPYSFLDVSSEARLLYDARQENYVAAIASKDSDGVFHAAVYLLGAPILDPVQPVVQKSRSPLMWILAVLGLLLAAGVSALLLRNRRKKETESAASAFTPAPLSADRPAVQLLGAFHVTGADGQDITGSFTPQTARFFTILLLYTAEYGGISNAKLKSLLWSDKSDESYNNNRGVTMKKVRTVLEQVGRLDFVSEGGQWKVSGDFALCDYLVAVQALRQENLPLEDLLSIAGWGPLLPEIQADYLDPFKSLYADRVLQKLEQVRTSLGDGITPAQSIQLADCALLFDALDEEAIRQKCVSLISLKRLGMAQQVFSRFADEFQHMMGEPFAQDFKDFVKK